MLRAKLSFILSSVAALAASFALSACNSSGPSGGGNSAGSGGAGSSSTSSTAAAATGGKTKIIVWHYFTEEQGKPFTELLDRFKKENPDIEVVSYQQGKPFELRQKLEASFAATPGTNPVMSTVYENWTSAFLARDLMDPVENYIGTPDGISKADVEDIVKAYREANSWDGKMVTMPFAKSIYMMYLNMDKLAKAGITTAPKTQDEWKTMVEKCTERQDSRIATYGAGMQPQSEAFTQFYLARGAEFFDKNGAPIFDGPEGVAVLELLQSLVKPNKSLYINTDYMSTPFRNQLIASYIYSSASFPYNTKGAADGHFTYQAAAIPGVDSNPNGKAVMQGMNFGVFKNKPEAERKAAMRLLKFLTETKNGVYWQTHSGYMPIRYSALKEPEMQEYMAKDPNYALASRLIVADKGRQEPKLAEWDGIRTDLSGVVDRVVNRGADPKTELTALRQKVAERLGKSSAGAK